MSPIALFLLISMAIVVYTDITRFIIPNTLVLALLALYPLAVYLAPVAIDWPMALAAMACVFVIGYFIFAKNWMGGGDIKLITVLSLWVGMEKIVAFFLLFAIFGGALSLVLLVGRKIVPHVASIKKENLPRVLKTGEPAPYGVAIAAAFVFMLVTGELALVAFQ